jgi:hypothetical protein
MLAVLAGTGGLLLRQYDAVSGTLDLFGTYLLLREGGQAHGDGAAADPAPGGQEDDDEREPH